MLLPFYHAVSDNVPLHIKHLYTPRSVAQFKADLDYFLTYYTPITLQEVIAINKGEKEMKENCFHLSFDDGLSEFYHIVAPILKGKGIPATVFLNADFIDNKALFYRFKVSILVDKLLASGLLNAKFKDVIALANLAKENGIDFDEYLKTEQPYLTSNQIKELIQQGFTFGAHSNNHPLYKDLTLKEQLSQTTESLTKVVNDFGLNYKAFSFPFTDDGVGAQFFDEIKEEVEITFGCAGLKKQTIPFHLQRLEMETAENAKSTLKTAYFYYFLKSLVGKNKVTRL